MTLAIFDLDNTLLDGDSDYLWGKFLVAENVVDAKVYDRENQRFYDEYKDGTMDIYEFLDFQLKPLVDNPLDKMLALREQFLNERIWPIIKSGTQQILTQHLKQNHTLMIITATNDFVTQPIAEKLNIETLIATELEMINNKYTGKVKGTPSYREGKVSRLETWLKKNGANLSGSYFYSDSHNDLPLLELVTHPVAVDADDTLTQHAEMKGWKTISLK
ncbi:MAG: HAD-IB family hydrolase [Gammaproteobacteria bacterium]|nr:HAD-IB family hydrolase [Gammaproteobacteria bacterium]